MMAISKEEGVQKISTSIFVTDFPDRAKAKDLWNVCKQYGQVVDAFIPNRKSKVGKRYGFVQFIRVYDVGRLVSNLCTLWMGSHHLHVNVARFQRPPAVNSGGYTHQNEAYEPALLLDESCLNQQDYSLGLLGKVKESSSFDNMRMVLANEGFNDINLRYMGGKRFSVRAKETTGWIPNFDEQEEDNSESEDAQSVGTDLDVNNYFDPFKLYPLLNKKRNVEEKMDKSNGTVSIPFPLGFTPCDETKVECDKKSMGNNEGNRFDNEKGESVSIGSRKSNKIDIKRTRGSLLTVMEELIKVGKTMGYNMEGCIKNIKEIIEIQ
nr:nucleotide-binding alpha-beta plait domain-containing protein [Tanacetum cinerariifolium]